MALGGSLLFNEGGQLDTAFLAAFRDLMRERVRRGGRFLIIVGGGRISRIYQAAARAVGVNNSAALDWVGIETCYLNAEFLRAVLGQDIVQPNHLRDFTVKIDEQYPVVFGGGIKPGSSKDYDACLWAVKVGTPYIARASNIVHVFERDPAKDPLAKPLKTLTWRQYRAIVGDTWRPGLATPFDPIAAQFAQKNKLAVRLFDGRNLAAFQAALNGKPFEGSIIK